MPNAWLLLSFGDDRQYAGNDGYDDDPQCVYRYDSFVANHRQISKGDLAVLIDRNSLIGCAVIEEVAAITGSKPRRRCPAQGCGTTAIKERETKTPTYRCKNGHEFVSPLEFNENCTKYEARYDHSFAPVETQVDVVKLRNACTDRSDQLAIKRLKFDLVADVLLTAAPRLRNLLDEQFGYLRPEDSEAADLSEQLAHYTPNGADERQRSMRQIAARRGQANFRKALLRRYGATCMISGCELLDVVEAAHISPYRGPNDNHIGNGLLLRTDLHTLFDLDLLGIEPETLTVALHPAVITRGYGCFDGVALRCGVHRPSKDALAVRWSDFQKRSRRAIASQAVAGQ